MSDVYNLEEGEEVGCFECMRQGDYTDYGVGEAFLCGPDHSPYDANANYHCREHLDSDAVIYEGDDK